MGIPQCPVVGLSDREVIKDFPDSIRGKVLAELNSRYQKYQAEVKRTQEHYKEEKNRFLQDLIETYNVILPQIREAIAQKRAVNIEIKGRNSGSPPSVQNWLKSNPGKALIIQEVFNQCQHQGWNPCLDISVYRIDSFGGESLIFTCSF